MLRPQPPSPAPAQHPAEDQCLSLQARQTQVESLIPHQCCQGYFKQRCQLGESSIRQHTRCAVRAALARRAISAAASRDAFSRASWATGAGTGFSGFAAKVGLPGKRQDGGGHVRYQHSMEPVLPEPSAALLPAEPRAGLQSPPPAAACEI